MAPLLLYPSIMSLRHLTLGLSTCILGTLCGCGEPEPGTPQASVVVGVTSEFRVPTDIHSVHLIMRQNNQVIRDETRVSGQGTPPLGFPMELTFSDLSQGDHVEAELEGIGGGTSNITLVRRLASTNAVAGRNMLLRARLETECVLNTMPASTCSAPQTCINGACRDSFVDPILLENYRADWWQTTSNDPCKPLGGGDPVVIVGKGQSDYLVMDDYGLAQVEAGPQGGHHVWVAIRTKNLKQSGSITTVSGTVPDLNLVIPPLNVIFTFDPDEGGYCKLYGLRYQLDSGGANINTLLGHVVKLTVKVSESQNGDIGVGEKFITLSDTIL